MLFLLVVALALPDETDASKARRVSDSFGDLQVAAGKFWGAQTQRSLENFKISDDFMPLQVVYGLALAKKAVTFASSSAIGEKKAAAIRAAADEVLSGQLDAHFPLKVWQTGSGTQSNMNVNEVLAFRATQIAGETVHPNDHCNWGQSSNDVFPTAMHISAYLFIKEKVFPVMDKFVEAMEAKAAEFKDIVKIGRTHLQDAVPLHLGDEFQTWAEQVKYAKGALEQSHATLLRLPIGGTAVGTGLNSKPGFAEQVVGKLAEFTGDKWQAMDHKFENIASHDTFVNVHGSLNTLASAAMKIANDLRLLGSGPRSGLGELSLPANEPGSSIMPGKVNPTQSEALTMVAAQVMGNHVAVTVGGSNGHLQLNAFKPLIIFNVLKSAQLLSGALDGFRTKCLVGIEANEENIKQGVDRSLMLVTALNKKIGYDKAAKIAKTAHANGATLKETAMKEGVSSADFDAWVVPKTMALGPRAEL